MGLMAFEVEITRNLIVSFIFLSQRDRIDPLLSLWEKTG
jgi:hypothetical protein